MSHFVCYCRVYPFFSFKVPELLKFRRQHADTEEEKKLASGIVKFEHGSLDTKLQGYTEEEATLIAQNVRARSSRPAWGTDIIEAGQAVLGVIPDGAYLCSLCKQHFGSELGRAKHITADHGDGLAKRRAA